MIKQPVILSVLPRWKSAMINLGNNKVIISVWIRTCCLLNTSQQYDSNCVRNFPTKQVVNICVNLSHLWLSNFDKTAITIS